MDKFIKKLKSEEKKSIVKVMAFMSYNPSIGRVMRKDSVKIFQKMAVEKLKELQKIKSAEDFDVFHNKWVKNFKDKIRTNNNRRCSHGQAQKAINVFLKVFVDWANLPDKETVKIILPFLHVPLDKTLMQNIKNNPVFCKDYIQTLQKYTSSFSLSKIDKETYYKWQTFFRKKHPQKPLLFDIVWAVNR